MSSEATSTGLTWAQVQKWEPDAVEAAARTLMDLEDDLTDYGLRAGKLAPESWTGVAAEFAQVQMTTYAELLEDRVTEMSAVRRALYDASDAMAGVKAAVKAAHTYAETHDLTIEEPDGRVVDNSAFYLGSDATVHDYEVAAEGRQHHVDECVALIEEALRRAHYTDLELNQILRDKVLSGSLADQEASSFEGARRDGARAGDLGDYQPPQAGSTPEQNAAWWAAHTPKQQAAILKDHPEWVANLNGIPFGIRAQANEKMLPRYQDQLEQQLEVLKTQRESVQNIATGANLTGYQLNQIEGIDRQITQTQSKLDELGKLRDGLGSSSLVGLDISHDRVEAIVANGDLDTADHIAVFTPGLTSTVESIVQKGGYNADMRSLKERTEYILEVTDPEAASQTVATVTWLGYQAPQWAGTLKFESDSVLSSASAREGGAALADFYRGIQSAGPTGDRDVVALGHSYGSTTTGYALSESGIGISRAAVFGSPGLGVSDLDDLHVPSGQSFYLETDNDPVGDLTRFATDPSALDGIVDLSTEAVPEENLAASSGHSQYLTNDTTSQYNLGALLARQEQQLFSGNSNAPVKDFLDDVVDGFQDKPQDLPEDQPESRLH